MPLRSNLVNLHSLPFIKKVNSPKGKAASPKIKGQDEAKMNQCPHSPNNLSTYPAKQFLQPCFQPREEREKEESGEGKKEREDEHLKEKIEAQGAFQKVK